MKILFVVNAPPCKTERCSNGFNARRLEEGYPEWKAAGLPVEGSER